MTSDSGRFLLDVFLPLLFCFHTGYLSHSLCDYKHHYHHLRDTYQLTICHKLFSTIHQFYSYNDLLGALLYIVFPLYSVWNSTFSHQSSPISDCGVIFSYFLFFITFGTSAVQTLHYVKNNSITTPIDYIQRFNKAQTKQSKYRRRKPPFYKRCQRRALFTATIVSSYFLPYTSGELDQLDLSSASQTLHKYIHKLNDNAATVFDNACHNNDQFLSFLVKDYDLVTSNHDNIFHMCDSMGFNTSDLPSLHSSPDIVRFQSLYNEESSSVGIVFDSGASISISPFATDFVEWDTTSTLNTTLHGVSDSPSVQGVGTIKFRVITDDGQECFLLTKGFYVPTSRVCLLSTIRYIQHERNGGSFTVNEDHCFFSFIRLNGGGRISFRPSKTNNLPIAFQRGSSSPPLSAFPFTTSSSSHSDTVFPLTSTESSDTDFPPCPTASSNRHLSPIQKDLLAIHNILCHVNMQWILRLFHLNIFTSKRGNISQVDLPLCHTCIRAKQTRQNEGTIHQDIRPEKDGGLKDGDLCPGATVSSDQYVSKQPGRLYTTAGKEDKQDNLFQEYQKQEQDHVESYFVQTGARDDSAEEKGREVSNQEEKLNRKKGSRPLEPSHV